MSDDRPGDVPPAPADASQEPPHPGRPRSVPPEVSPRARRLLRRILRPIDAFLHVQSASGVVLLAAALVALVWANSPWAASYEHLWHANVTLGLGPWVTTRSLHFWINDGLMTVFFFVVGLEVRRELHHGELADLRRAALPVAAALGGMVVPAAIFAVVTRGGPGARGWGVPMATDIAFALGVLALLGRRVPAALRVLLLALAIIDDIGAIAVIAVFYASGFSLAGLGVVAVGVAAVIGMQRAGVRQPWLYVPPGALVWFGALRAGIHPTLAGVALGLLTPVRPWHAPEAFLLAARGAIEDFEARAAAPGKSPDPHELIDPLDALTLARRRALAPVVRIERALHPWVAFGIMPLFALANAGVPLGRVDLETPGAAAVLGGVAAGLLVGKPLGVVAASALAVRLGLATLPRGVGWRGVAVVGAVSGIGFTMAIFIAGLAFPDGSHLGVAKLGVLIATAAAGLLGLGLGRFTLPAAPPPDAADEPSEAEASAEV
ncbi:MAG: Na+/H+ antiporter NhaA [Deltaproteobacteria bacterium]|nr:Na+/H+ antiporter NhaA [Myxococcales bacterium]MDP3216618.1 Na+/H+ antiporter NhaA [Deltaproteobacteria bacterium]